MKIDDNLSSIISIGQNLKKIMCYLHQEEIKTMQILPYISLVELWLDTQVYCT